MTDKATFWLDQLRLAKKRERKWLAGAPNLVKRYRDDKRSAGSKFNIFWANTETLKAPVYSKTPKPDVRRRFADADSVAKRASEVLERALSFALDDYDFDLEMERVRDDVLIIGRAQARVKYNATIVRRDAEAVQGENGELIFVVDGQPVEPEFDDDGAFIEEKTEESSTCEYVYWDDFRMSPARRWKHVWWVSFKHEMTKVQLVKQFKERGKLVSTESTSKDDPDDDIERAIVWEIWNRKAKKVIWIAEGFDQVLEEDDPPIRFKKFFPCPEPVYAIKTNDTMVPKSEFSMYEDQADQLDEIEDRINKLTKALKAAGVYDAVEKTTISLLQDAKDGELIPISEGASLRDKGGLRGAIWYQPIGEIAQVLAALYLQRNELKQTIFEITGISDIIRGSTKASETLGAQELKSRFSAVRLEPRSRPMQYFVRDLLRLKSEIMAEQFSPETWQKMTGLEVPPDVMELLRDDSALGFRVDIETDSTIRDDVLQDKSEVAEFITSLTQYLQIAVPAAEQNPVLGPMLAQILLWAVRRMKTGRDVENVIQETMQKLIEGEPKSDPENDTAQAELALQQKKIDGELALQEKKIDGELAIKVKEAENKRTPPITINAEDDQVAESVKAALSMVTEDVVQATQAIQLAVQQIAQLIQQANQPKVIVRDPETGRAVGIRAANGAG